MYTLYPSLIKGLPWKSDLFSSSPKTSCHCDAKTVDVKHWQDGDCDILELTERAVNPLAIGYMCHALGHQIVVTQTNTFWFPRCSGRKRKDSVVIYGVDMRAGESGI